MNRRSSALSGVAVAALALAALPASAHHGWGAQSSEQFELSGTLESAVSFGGPHATMQIRDGEGRVWDITLGPPSRTARSGLMEDTIPVGAEVTIRGNRNSDPNRFEVKTVRVTYEGTNYDVYPNRIS